MSMVNERQTALERFAGRGLRVCRFDTARSTATLRMPRRLGRFMNAHLQAYVYYTKRSVGLCS